MRLGSFIRQCQAVTRYNLETIWERRAVSVVAIFGIAGVVGVMVAVLSMAAGFRAVVTGQARDDVAVVLRSGATGASDSILNHQDIQVLWEAPGVARGPDGPLVSPELFVIIDRKKIGAGTDANVPLRGVEAAGFALREQFEIVEGRNFEPGRNEVIVGDGAAGAFEGLQVGDRIDVGRASWEVVGRFTTGGGVAESEIWTDNRILQQMYQRGNSWNIALVRLRDAEAFEGFEQALTDDPRVSLGAERQTTHMAAQSEPIEAFISVVGWIIVVMMSAGAVFAALNTMYAAVSSRSREIATLRALGFSRLPVVVSVMIESLVFGLIGAAAGGAASWLLFDGFRAATINWASFSQVAFAFQVTPELLVQGTTLALVIGAIGGFLPAVGAARRSVVGALREQ
ncbi:MAG: ABC transporter permease [Acidobacteria bacterium]|nr:ABC transporter permease [Acidobacteriota bacterium]